MVYKKSEIIKLMTSFEPEVINSRFLVQYSKMNNGVNPVSFMLIVLDLKDEGFTIKFFKDKESVISMIKLLKMV